MAPYIYNILKLRKCQIYQSTQNFTLISKMYSSICLSSVVFDLWLFKVWKWPILAHFGKMGHFRLWMAINQKLLKINIQSYTFLKSAWNSASIGIPYLDIWKTSNFGLTRGSQVELRGRFLSSECQIWIFVTLSTSWDDTNCELVNFPKKGSCSPP